MRINLKKCVCIGVLLLGSVLGSQAQSRNYLIVYEAPKELEVFHNDDFTVKVRKPGGKWQDLFEHAVKVDEVVETGHTVQMATMTAFDFEGNVEVSVTYNKGVIKNARIRPLSYGIVPTIEKNRLTFSLSEAANLSVEVNGDIFHNLHLFANPLETEIPDPNDPNVIYFQPGIHEVKGEKLEIESGKTVYLAGGAVVKGQLSLEGVSDVKILGRGIVDQEVRLGVHIANSQNVRVEGVFASQCLAGGSDQVKIINVKTISFFGWGDGMNVMASDNVYYDRIFVRSSDDCHTVYATRKGFEGGAKNITMQNATLWADVAHPIQIGLHGNSVEHDVIENLKYTNIDILDHKEMQIDYQGCLSINVGDNNLVKNVLFEDIRVEDFREGQLLNLRLVFNKKYCTAPGKGIENVLFRNIEYTGKNADISIISGYDESRKISGITFENLKINGVLIHDKMDGKPAWYKTSDMASFYIGEHVEGVTFIKTEQNPISSE